MQDDIVGMLVLYIISAVLFRPTIIDFDEQKPKVFSWNTIWQGTHCESYRLMLQFIYMVFFLFSGEWSGSVERYTWAGGRCSEERRTHSDNSGTVQTRRWAQTLKKTPYFHSQLYDEWQVPVSQSLGLDLTFTLLKLMSCGISQIVLGALSRPIAFNGSTLLLSNPIKIFHKKSTAATYRHRLFIADDARHLKCRCTGAVL